MLHSTLSNRRRAFSLIELVIVVVIIGIIAAIAIPRMSRGAAGAADNSLASNLAMLRKAVELYAAEHNNTFPTLAAMNAASPNNALLNYTSADGATFAAAPGASTPFGPYLRSIPALNVGAVANRNATFKAGAADGSGTAGWTYDAATGSIFANVVSTTVDATGKAYNTY